MKLTSENTVANNPKMLNTIRKAWNWTGLNPAEIVCVNSFGNLIVKAADGTYWRICPEEMKCEKIAAGLTTFDKLSHSQDFQLDWEMKRLVVLAEKKLGPLKSGRCYCFKVSPVLGGTYDESNLAEISLEELIAFSGDLAEQIKDVPDGGKIELQWVP